MKTTMKSMVNMSACVRAVCQHASACLPLTRGLCSSVVRRTNVDFASKTVVAQQPCVTDARCFQITRNNMQIVTVPEKRELQTRTDCKCQTRRHKAPTAAPDLSLYSPHAKPLTAVNIQSLFEEDVILELCSRLADFPSSDRAEGLATLLRACVWLGLEAQSPPVLRLMNECLEVLSKRDIEVAQLCHLGEVACALEGHNSPIVTEVLNCMDVAVEEDVVSPSEAATVYSLLTLLHDPASQQQVRMLSTLHMHTQRQVHRLKASQLTDILQSLLKLQQKRAISLMLRLSHRASRVFKAFRDDEIIKVLSALMILGQYDEELLAAMENHLPERLEKCDPELISTVMEYCLRMRCRSEPIFEAVAENFVCNAERHTTLQITKQVVAMGRLNYLPQPRMLIDLLHSCIHLERFPLNHMAKVFSPYFLQKLQAHEEPLDKNTLGQLTQLHLSTSLECTYYLGPRLPVYFHVKRFSSVDQAFEVPMDNVLYKQVRGPLGRLLGGTFYSTKVFSHSGYTIDVEICLDENGFILPLSQWDHTYKRIALCLDGQNRFCSNTQNLLGKEATKKRHLRRMGYELVEIPYFEFERLGTQEEQVQYLHSKIYPTISKLRMATGAL
ncbi:FAST kinase domain-containing protein 3, mitochondrial-like isoform X2 [Parambassis ranga]|uniref:FAST kinase domain-containing protein 3, mitochondrial-like isoform X2 n=1 Tax=Parambassis ranga TaxID=210632 RepID=A0A6P7H7K0_9TELE|nr:FAST kinase domain-containing protein 3, mitochondrial-like isoform X2 [Parambassis ranga]